MKKDRAWLLPEPATDHPIYYLYSPKGRLMKKYQPGPTGQISLSGLRPGMYYIVEQGTGQVGKLIKQ